MRLDDVEIDIRKWKRGKGKREWGMAIEYHKAQRGICEMGSVTRHSVID